MNKIYLLVVGLLIILVGLTLFLRGSSTPNTPTETVVPTPFSSITPSQTIHYVELKEVTEGVKLGIINKLPVRTPRYDIEYLRTSDRFVVSIKESPVDKYKDEAKQWFRDNGVADPDNANIYFIVPRFIQE